MDNYFSLNAIPYKNFRWYLIILFLLLIIFISSKLVIYDSQKFFVIYLGDNLFEASIPINSSDSVTRGKFAKINGKNYKYIIKDISPMEATMDYSYNIYTISIENTQSIINEINEITFYYDRQNLLKKIAKIII